MPKCYVCNEEHVYLDLFKVTTPANEDVGFCWSCLQRNIDPNSRRCAPGVTWKELDETHKGWEKDGSI